MHVALGRAGILVHTVAAAQARKPVSATAARYVSCITSQVSSFFPHAPCASASGVPSRRGPSAPLPRMNRIAGYATADAFAYAHVSLHERRCNAAAASRPAAVQRTNGTRCDSERHPTPAAARPPPCCPATLRRICVAMCYKPAATRSRSGPPMPFNYPYVSLSFV